VKRPLARTAERRIARLRGELERREQELEAYRDNARVPLSLGPDRFARGVEVRAKRLEEAALAISRAKAKGDLSRLPSADELRVRWPTMTYEERRDAMAEIFDCVFVSPRTTEGVQSRLFVCLRGSGPAGLPRDNPRQTVGFKPFDPTGLPPSPRLRRRAKDWPELRLRERLAGFLQGRERWPTFREFQTADQTELWQQVERHAGERRWAKRMGVVYAPPPTDQGPWPEHRVRAELASYLEGKTSWPTTRQFAADGKQALRRAARWQGGPERWAQEMNVQLETRQRSQERWTEARIRADLAEFVGNRKDWPPRREFDAAGLARLYSAIDRAGIRDRLAADLGLYMPPGRRSFKRRWTDDGIRAALDQLIEGRETFPTVGDFRRANLMGLYVTLTREGTRRTWARRYGFDPVR
jgi:hypothetical protein